MLSLIGALQLRIVRLWLWFKGRVEARKAEPWLIVLSFFESFLIPVPVDPFMAAMILADRARWFWVALFATISSTIGAVVGYGIGFFAFDLLGAWFAGVADKSAFLERMTLLFSDHALALTFAAALTPIPNAPVVIAAGFVGTNVIAFAVVWFVARAIRFMGVGYIVYAFGIKTLSRFERSITIATIALVLIMLSAYAYAASGI